MPAVTRAVLLLSVALPVTACRTQLLPPPDSIPSDAAPVNPTAPGVGPDNPIPNPPAIAIPQTTLAAGWGHACVRMPDATARCWGDDTMGELGDAPFHSNGGISHLIPVEVAGLTGVVSVAAGEYFSCALVTGGKVKCWGDLFPLKDPGPFGTPVDLKGVEDAAELSVGYDTGCARIADGTIRCWGFNSHGELGDGTKLWRDAPVTVAEIHDAIQVSTGLCHSSCALLSDRTVKCWGNNSWQQLGNIGSDATTPQIIPGLHEVAMVSAGVCHNCALIADGTVRCWGDAQYGQLGDGSMGDHLSIAIPVVVRGLDDAVAISAGWNTTCALRRGGTISCWGLYEGYPVPDFRPHGTTTPEPIPDLSDVIEVSRGSLYSLVRKRDRSVWWWGEALFFVNSGQVIIQPTPARIPTL